MLPGVPLIEVTRRDWRTGTEVVESVHTGHVALVDGDGHLQGGLGEPGTVVFPRSAVKPFQATACLELLGEAAAALSDDELAVAWGSHNGEEVHAAAVRRLLARSGTAPEQLTCPAAPPKIDPGAIPQRLLHNCSGKHALFALTGQALGTANGALLDPEASLQVRVLRSMAEVLGPLAAVGTDGCGAPAVAVPLQALAHGFRSLVADPRFAPIRDAGLRSPSLVAGTGTVVSAVLSAGVVVKSGAEGVYAAGWIGQDGGPKGLAIKATDGSPRCSETALITLLEALDLVPRGTWAPPPPLGGGVPAGILRPTRPLRHLVRTCRDVE